jgi:hypothetical protein
MNLGAIFIGFAILVVAIPFVIIPLVNERKKQPGKPAFPKKDGQGRQLDALVAIRDLDFDFQTGKVTPEDYAPLRSQLILEAAEYLQMKKEEDEKIEKMIRARLQAVKGSDKCEACGGDIHPSDQFCPTCGVDAKNQAELNKSAPQIACPRCGKSVKAGDLFCTGCGTKLYGQQTIGNTTAEN